MARAGYKGGKARPAQWGRPSKPSRGKAATPLRGWGRAKPCTMGCTRPVGSAVSDPLPEEGTDSAPTQPGPCGIISPTAQRSYPLGVCHHVPAGAQHGQTGSPTTGRRHLTLTGGCPPPPLRVGGKTHARWGRAAAARGGAGPGPGARPLADAALPRHRGKHHAAGVGPWGFPSWSPRRVLTRPPAVHVPCGSAASLCSPAPTEPAHLCEAGAHGVHGPSPWPLLAGG